ncbi:MAG TPA: PAS domain S-box protein [Smithellaceae bacterium]|nr:PAS domain S-box protein [Smithellaceae bacterium]
MATKSEKQRIASMMDRVRRAAAGAPAEFLDVGPKRDDLDRLAEAINALISRLGQTAPFPPPPEETGRRYQNILDSIQESYFETDLAGTILFFNDRASRELGCQSEELLGGDFRNFMDEANAARVFEAFHQVFKTGQPVTGLQWCFQRKDQSRMDVESSVALLCDDNGRPTGFRGVVRNISDRKRTERELRESEERYRTILDIMEEAYLEYDLQGTITFANEAACSMFDCRPDELIGLNYRDYHFPADAQKVKEVFRRIYETGRPRLRFDHDIKIKNGEIRSHQVNAALKLDETGAPCGFRVLTWDVTERKKAQEAFSQSEKRYRMIVENMHDTIWTMDLNLNYTYQSPSEVRVTGYTPEEIMHLPIQEILTPESYDRAVGVLSRELRREQSGEPVDPDRSTKLELEMRHKDGHRIWQEVTASFNRDDGGRPVEILFTGRDITQRKKMEEELRDSERRYRMIVENMQDTISVLDMDLNYLYQSPSEINITGYTPEEIMRIPIDRQATPETFSRAAAILAEELAREQSGQPVDPNRSRTFELEIYHKQGGTVWLEVTASFNRDESGRPSSILLAGRNISERKKAALEREQLEKKLLQLQRLETVGRLAGGVAHDFNNMLNVILGYVDLVKLRLPPEHAIYGDILEIEKAAERSRDLTSQLLAFSRKQIIKPRPVNLNTLIMDAQKAVIRLIGEDIDFAFHPAADLWTIQFDPLQAEQILMNLAVNARDAMPQGGKLTVETANVFLDDVFCRQHLECEPGAYVRLTVTDNGTGIESRYLPYVFEPFFTTKDVGKGTGLGLATVYGIVKQNNGFISVYSEPGHGSAFKVYLPRIDGPADVRMVQPEPAKPGTGTILLVEDDEMVLKMVTEMLEAIGYMVIAAESPVEALSICEKGSAPIDLVLSDVVMPVMSGREMRDRLRGIRPDLKVLFMSGYTSNVIVQHGVLEEGVQFIQKPFSLSELARRVKDLIAKP